MDPRTDKLIRRTAMAGTVTAAYFLITADYGPQDHALLPITRAIKSMESSLKRFVFGSGDGTRENEEDVHSK
ncbi:hypothetical protein C4D60_Mb07t10530 [Musa balbisiana]|uniref:Uncharacterized protein n=1 Tax=Musa balbisiana TaxID=52838 RepID=A0A4S8JEE0_MUSBA|nr:hypothetical protein C4D60_Mb07t10530 [Musa balbisiana]